MGSLLGGNERPRSNVLEIRMICKNTLFYVVGPIAKKLLNFKRALTHIGTPQWSASHKFLAQHLLESHFVKARRTFELGEWAILSTNKRSRGQYANHH